MKGGDKPKSRQETRELEYMVDYTNMYTEVASRARTMQMARTVEEENHQRIMNEYRTMYELRYESVHSRLIADLQSTRIISRQTLDLSLRKTRRR